MGGIGTTLRCILFVVWELGDESLPFLFLPFFLLIPYNDMKKVVIENIGGSFSIYDEAGQCIEPDFKSYKAAKEWANNNKLEVVESFFV